LVVFGWALGAGLLGVLVLAGSAVAADDVTPPSGTLTVNDGSGATNDLDITIHAPATDDVGVVSTIVSVNGVFSDPIPYAESIPYTLPELGDVSHVIQVEWMDAAGNGMWSDGVEVLVDRSAPTLDAATILQEAEEAEGDGMYPVQVSGSDVLAWIRMSPNGSTWGAPIAYAGPAMWPALDPAFGGSSRLGQRTAYVQAGDAARNWSNTRTVKLNVLADAPLAVSPVVPRTGHTITITPTWPHGVTFPSGTYCSWEVLWGNDRSLYEGDRDSTFGSFYAYGGQGAGYCKPLSFTLPWMQYPQMLVSYRAELPDGGVIEASIGGSPDRPAIEPVIDGTSRRITSSNIPLIYVLPEDYILIVGEPTTYRAYAVGGATFDPDDTWFADYGDNPIQQIGGTSFTFMPRRTGYVTVCFNSDTTKSVRWSACFDPPARYRDPTRPHTTTPVARIGSGAVSTSVPVSVTWNGADTGWGIHHYTLQRSRDGGSWATVYRGRATSWTGSIPVGRNDRYRVRAIDKAGNVGYWDTGPTLKARVTEDTSSSITYGKGWTSVPDATARGGSIHEHSAADIGVRYTATVRDIAWIAEKGPGHGRASVYVDGVLATTVDLEASSDSARRIVYRRHWSSAGSHTIRIVVAGTVGRPVVSLDGFVRLR
jgi:hypothetical protein